MSQATLHLPGAPLPPRSTVVTVGTFDGVHRGHQAVLAELMAVARHHRKKNLVVTFDPHPLYVVGADEAPDLLSPTREKVELLSAEGVDQVAVVPFSQELAEYSPHRFVQEILISHFGLDHLVIGYDHGFGKGRSGDVSTLLQIGHELNFELTVVPHTDLGERPIKSSRIRTALLAGDVVEGARALGRPYSIDGEVVRGDGRGRQLGFPTANLRVLGEHKLIPAEGIYAVRVQRMVDLERVDPTLFDGALHLGERPTFPGASATVEVFLLGFEGELYGEKLRVRFCQRLRGVDRFESVEALVRAMHEDVAAARRLFAGGAGACGGK